MNKPTARHTSEAEPKTSTRTYIMVVLFLFCHAICFFFHAWHSSNEINLTLCYFLLSPYLGWFTRETNIYSYPYAEYSIHPSPGIKLEMLFCWRCLYRTITMNERSDCGTSQLEDWTMDVHPNEECVGACWNYITITFALSMPNNRGRCNRGRQSPPIELLVQHQRQCLNLSAVLRTAVHDRGSNSWCIFFFFLPRSAWQPTGPVVISK